jgi:hypothetical protein
MWYEIFGKIINLEKCLSVAKEEEKSIRFFFRDGLSIAVQLTTNKERESKYEEIRKLLTL